MRRLEEICGQLYAWADRGRGKNNGKLLKNAENHD